MIQLEQLQLTAVIPHATTIVGSVTPVVSACAMPTGASSVSRPWWGIIGRWKCPPRVVVPIATVKVDIGARAAAIAPAMAFAPIAAVAGFFSFDTVQDMQ